jgi:hypothetical protein
MLIKTKSTSGSEKARDQIRGRHNTIRPTTSVNKASEDNIKV